MKAFGIYSFVTKKNPQTLHMLSNRQSWGFLIAESSNKRLNHCYQTGTEVRLLYHGIIVAVDHDGSTASQVNILFPPVTDLCQTQKNVILDALFFRLRLTQDQQ